jgi:hypothetical protein
VSVDRCTSLKGDCCIEGLVADGTGGVDDGLGDAGGNGADNGVEAAGSADGDVDVCSFGTIIVFLSRRPRMVPWLRLGAACY